MASFLGAPPRAEGSGRVIVTWSPRALAHLRSLRAHIAQSNPEAAADTASTLLTAVVRLSELPNLGRPGRLAGTRELVVPGTQYIVAYRVRSGRLDILAVFHGRQKWPDQL